MTKISLQEYLKQHNKKTKQKPKGVAETAALIFSTNCSTISQTFGASCEDGHTSP